MAPNMKPIFCATHPRACSTAFERVFMTRPHDLICFHEPFGDAFYYGPERLSRRYESDVEARTISGFSNSSYKTLFDQIFDAGSEGKRAFIKDMAYYFFPPDAKPSQIAPSLEVKKRGIGTGTNGASNDSPVTGAPYPYKTPSEPGNPSVVPESLLDQFHFAFLIRDPHSSVPSYYRCCIPPLDKVTGFYEYYPNEAGYDELRRLFEFLRKKGQVSSKIAKRISGTVPDQSNGHANGDSTTAEICVIDADELLDDPETIVQSFCKSVGLDYSPDMLEWGSEESQKLAEEAFAKWKGWHEDALDSKDLKPRTHKKAAKTEAQWDAEWQKKFGAEGARIIRETVDKNMEDYLYLKQFTLKG